MASKGFCTMDPDIGEWVQFYFGRDRQATDDGNQMMSLDKATSLLLPKNENTASLMKRRHSAGADAELHRLVFCAMVRLRKKCVAESSR